jgi:hypothetical protein
MRFTISFITPWTGALDIGFADWYLKNKTGERFIRWGIDIYDGKYFRINVLGCYLSWYKS